MKTALKISLILLVTATAFQACKDKENDPEPQAETKTYLTAQNEDNVETTYHYDGSTIVMATGESGDTTWFSYSNGKLSKAEDNMGTEAFFTFASGNIPSKIEVKINGSYDTDYIISSSNDQISKVEIFPHGQTSNPNQRLILTYDNDELNKLELSINDGSNNYIPFISADSIVTDGKLNPYQMDFAITYMNFENPFAFNSSNVTDASVTVIGNPTAFATTYTYNSEGFVTIADIDIPGAARYTEFTYSKW